jgi:hypothetical protein
MTDGRDAGWLARFFEMDFPGILAINDEKGQTWRCDSDLRVASLPPGEHAKPKQCRSMQKDGCGQCRRPVAA